MISDDFRGKHILLREQKIEDAKYFAHWYNQPQVMFQCGFVYPTDEEKEKATILRHRDSADSVWFTITDPDGNVIGEAGLLRMWPEWHCTDLTVIIPDPNHQHRGYGTEAVRHLLSLAFDTFEMNRVAVGVVGQNANALAFYRRIGFKQEGIQEQGYYHNGEYSDFVMMRLLRSEWK